MELLTLFIDIILVGLILYMSTLLYKYGKTIHYIISNAKESEQNTKELEEMIPFIIAFIFCGFLIFVAGTLLYIN